MVTRMVVVTLVAAYALAGPVQQADDRKQVMAVVEGAIKLINEKKYAELFNTYMWPAERDELAAKFGSVDNAAAEMAKRGEGLAIVLKQLQTAAKLEPSFENNGTIARFRFDAPVGRDTGLKLEKLKGRWYLRD